MKLLALALVGLIGLSPAAKAAQEAWWWWGATNPVPVSAANPLPVTVSGGLTVMKTDGSNAAAAALGNIVSGATGCNDVTKVVSGTGTCVTPAAGGITQLTGAVTAGPGSGSQVATITSTISAAGPIGSATVAPVITFNAAGQLTTVTSATIAPPFSAITGTPTTLSGYGITDLLHTGAGAVTLAGPGTAQTYTLPATAKTLMASDYSNASPAALSLTSLALGGATIGTNALAVTGTALISGQLALGTNGIGIYSTPSTLTSLRVNLDNNGLLMQGNTGVLWNPNNPISAGNDTGLFRISAGVLAVGNGGAGDFSGGMKMTTLNVVGSSVNMAGLGTSSAATTGTLCWTTGTGLVNVDTTLACLSSSIRFKHDAEPLTNSLAKVLAMEPISFVRNDKPELGRQIGLMAEQVETVDPRLVGYDDAGKPLGVRYMNAVALLVGAIKEQQHKIEALEAR
jgi:hypothetical protein